MLIENVLCAGSREPRMNNVALDPVFRNPQDGEINS